MPAKSHWELRQSIQINVLLFQVMYSGLKLVAISKFAPFGGYPSALQLSISLLTVSYTSKSSGDISNVEKLASTFPPKGGS